MARHKVDICGVDTANIKILSNDEMNELFRKYQKGDMESKEELIKGNLKLVLSILKKYNNRIDNMDDLFQVGVIGLIKAIDNFDLSHEVRFSTYAVPMILGEVKRYLRDNSSIRVARSIKDTAYRIMKVKEELTNKYNKEPSTEMIAKELGITPYEISIAYEAMKDTISMSEPIYSDGGDTIYLEDQLEDKKDESNNIDLKISLHKAMLELKDKEKYILVSRYVVGKTQMELANELGISQAQISRLEKSGLKTLKKKMI